MDATAMYSPAIHARTPQLGRSLRKEDQTLAPALRGSFRHRGPIEGSILHVLRETIDPSFEETDIAVDHPVENRRPNKHQEHHSDGDPLS